jgi:shikimate kinase
MDWPAIQPAPTHLVEALANRHLCLCGFMAAGKTLVGHRLAVRLALPFVDLDDYLTRTRGRTPAALIGQEGEAAFREIEADALHRVLNGKPSVVALGGGTLLRDENRALVLDRAIVVHLKVSAETARARALAETDRDRPLLGETLEDTRRRLEERRIAYACCDFEVDADCSDPEAVTAAVLAGLGHLSAL